MKSYLIVLVVLCAGHLNVEAQISKVDVSNIDEVKAALEGDWWRWIVPNDTTYKSYYFIHDSYEGYHVLAPNKYALPAFVLLKTKDSLISISCPGILCGITPIVEELTDKKLVLDYGTNGEEIFYRVAEKPEQIFSRVDGRISSHYYPRSKLDLSNSHPIVEKGSENTNSIVLQYNWAGDVYNRAIFIELSDTAKIEIGKEYFVPNALMRICTIHYGVFSNFHRYKNVTGTVKVESITENGATLKINLAGEWETETYFEYQIFLRNRIVVKQNE